MGPNFTNMDIENWIRVRTGVIVKAHNITIYRTQDSCWSSGAKHTHVHSKENMYDGGDVP